ncbi:Leu/Ile/Val-binding protein precursor [Sodalis glossinidius str. 'morsitans']|uniref:Leu/Ile/Val-binding protein n=1 Tax=Sodalis glossinidius (strain morsitans) TaxID=343509 RepID=A0A193QG94_SODGM|nr:Leu/Ile/Val-binding protein precursor [Sodalis glossinidius str. 'morsitans']
MKPSAPANSSRRVIPFTLTLRWAIAAAFKATGGSDSAKASDWLKSYSVDTVMGPKSWDSKGDLKVSDYVVYQWDNKGKYQQVP